MTDFANLVQADRGQQAMAEKVGVDFAAWARAHLLAEAVRVLDEAG